VVGGAVRRAGAAVRRRHRLLREESDRGYSVLEASITLPIIFFLLMIIVPASRTATPTSLRSPRMCSAQAAWT
jgi:hypothetical protein